MSPIQQMLLGVGAVATKTYVDDVFSTYVYEGNGNSSRNITNNIDLLTEGGLVWYKSRSAGKGHRLVDTERGVTKVIESNDSNGEAVEATGLKAFLTNGFTVGSDDTINESGGDHASWTFRKAPGFFDVVTYTGNGSARTISHSLGSVPGLILIKLLGSSGDWQVYHRSIGNTKYLELNTTGAASTNTNRWNDTSPTSTHFSLGTDWKVNSDTANYVAYVFAGGEEQGNASVKFQGSDGYIKLNSSSNWSLTGQFCLEYWVYMTANNIETPTITWGNGYYRALFWSPGSSNWRFQWPTGNSNVNMGGTAPTNTWKHHVLTRDSNNVLRFFIDGELIYNTTETDNMGASEDLFFGYKANNTSGGLINGNLSNVRIVNGSIPTTYQTSSTTNGASIFTSPTSPLSTTSQGATASDVKLLCCNDIGASGFTKSPSPIIVVGSLEGNKTNSPFAASTATDASAVFGESGSESVIKCGSYVGDSSNVVDINLGWEPSFILVKNITTTSWWLMIDNMRGVPTGGNTELLVPNESQAENNYSTNYVNFTSTGFQAVAAGNGNISDADETFVYLAIRRPDGYVGKPVELGTGVFAMDAGNSSSTESFTSGFPVDFALYKDTDSTSDFYASGRFIQEKFLKTNLTNAESGSDTLDFDSNTGFGVWNGFTSDWQSWMWKRHAGFDVVTYKGNGSTTGHQITHSLNKIPDMMWVKNRDNGNTNWIVYHKGLNGGSSPEDYYLKLDQDAAEADDTFWNDTAPTATHFTVGEYANVNSSNQNHIAMLFASVSGVSKVGSYTGSGSTGQTITTGFQPRFVILRNASDGGHWYVLDTTRGWGSGDDKHLQLDNTSGNGTYNFGAPTSNGFTLDFYNDSNSKYIYYAHA